MSSRYDRDNDLQGAHDSDPQDREISLGTTTILGIFFALALLCAVFFGFGYSLGRRSAPPAPIAAEAVAEPDSNKPSSGSPQSQGPSASHPSDAAGEAEPHDDSASEATDRTQQEPAPVKSAVYPLASETRPSGPAKASVSRSAAVAGTGGQNGAGAVVVQVAAVSHQEDADMLANALKQRGYSVSIRQMPQDSLLHVQVGPFPSKKDAEAMRQRLQADGYNAIVK